MVALIGSGRSLVSKADRSGRGDAADHNGHALLMSKLPSLWSKGSKVNGVALHGKKLVHMY